MTSRYSSRARHAPGGLSGTSRRYLLIVAMLATFSSLPTLAAISAGTATLSDFDPQAPATPLPYDMISPPPVVVGGQPSPATSPPDDAASPLPQRS